MQSYSFMGIESPVYKMKRVTEMGGGGGCSAS